jgi:hypothetical protein
MIAILLYIRSIYEIPSVICIFPYFPDDGNGFDIVIRYILYLASFPSEHSGDFIVTELAMDLEMGFSIGSYFFNFFDRYVFQKKDRFRISFSEGC